MKTFMYVVIGLVVTGVLFAGGLFMVGVGMNNTAVRMENAIEAQFEQNKNTRSKMVNAIAEAAQVPDMYKNDFKEVVGSAMEGRYGKDGSKAVFQWIQEHQINFDASLYGKIQTMIESNRAEFALEQEKLIDKKRVYDVKLETFPSNVVLGMLGYPKINMEDFKVVVSADTAKVFSEGTEGPMKLR